MQLPALPLLTADLPGIGGQIKTVPEDFEVEEIPAYEPAGEGPHLFLWIQKRNRSTPDLLRHVARHLGLSVSEIGCAGLKDRHALTRQWLSVPESAEPRLAQLDDADIEVLRVSRHRNKLRTGHLRGNRFRVLVRGVATDCLEKASAIVARLRAFGLPNFFGEQRFGHHGQTALCGMALLQGKPIPDPSDARPTNRPTGRPPRTTDPLFRRLALSAVQSLAYNDYLAERINDGLYRRVLPGDVMTKWPTGGLFCAEHLSIEQTRLDAHETVTAGPIFGRKTFPARDEAARREQLIRQRYHLEPANLTRFGKLMAGTRRPNQVYLDDLTMQLEPDGLRLSFSLPAGSYATVLLRELMKPAVGNSLADESNEDEEPDYD
jgi:tRNA pseudouridine13 synthase